MPQETEIVEPYAPSQEVKDYLAEFFDDMDDCISARNQKYPELDDMRPMEYVDESRMRDHGYLPDLGDDDTGPNVFFNKTRNKKNIIKGFVAAQRPRVEVSARGKNSPFTDKQIAEYLRNAYDYSMDKEYADEIYSDWTDETLVTGTGPLMEYYDYQERIQKYVSSMNWDNGKKKYKEKKVVVRDDCRAKVLRLDSLYFPTYHVESIDELPFYIYQEVVLKSVAETTYGKFPNWKYVKCKGEFKADGSDGEQFYYKRWSERLKDPFVEILHRIDPINDRHDIEINGVLMTEMDNPILYDHKKPFIVLQYYEKIKGFLLGKSLPMKIVYAQDTFNELMNANIKRSRSSSHVSFLTSLESEIQQDYVGDWEIVKTNDAAGLREAQIRSVQQGDVNIATMVSEEIDESTAPRTLNGEISGETATAILNAVRQATQNLGTQLIYIYAAAKRHAELRLSNILQFMFNANLKGEAFEMREINMADVKLQDGKKGVRIIRVVDSKDKIPPKEERDAEIARGIVKKTGKDGKKKDVVETNYDIVYITPEDIADLSYKIKVIPGSSLPDIQSLRKAMLLEMVNTGSSALLQQYPDFLELWKLICEEFGYNPDDITKPQEQLDQAVDPTQPGMMQPGQAPQGAPANSELVQQMAGSAKPGLKQLLGA